MSIPVRSSRTRRNRAVASSGLSWAALRWIRSTASRLCAPPDRAASEAAGNVFKGVDPASPAYAAGLRDGMKWLGREAAPQTPGALSIRVQDGAAERVLSYVRKKSGERTRQVVSVAPGLTAEVKAACARAAGG